MVKVEILLCLFITTTKKMKTHELNTPRGYED